MNGSPVAHIVDDDEALRDSLSFLLAAADIAVETYPSAEGFLSVAADLQGGCVVTDVRMPGMSGIEMLRALRESNSPMRVIVMTGHGDIPLAVEAMKLGAVDFIEKPFDDDHFVAAVRRALLRREDDEQTATRRADVQRRLESLSDRERQVLDGLIEGNPNKAIALDLGISPRTVEIYRANLMTKMGARSLSELVRLALLVEAEAEPSKI